MKQSVIKMRQPGCFSFQECHWYLDRNFDDCTVTLEQDGIYKAIQAGNEKLLLHVTASPGFLNTRIISGKVTAETRKLAKAYIAEWFDLERDLTPFYDLLKKDRKLAYMCRDFCGLRLLGMVELFEALCWSVIGQQINLAFAYTLKRRLVERYGTHLEHEGKRHLVFPDYHTLAAAGTGELKAMQFSARKAEYIIGIARAFAEGTLSKEKLQQLPGLESKQNALLQIRGIGIWTANYVLMKSLKEISSIPHGDAGLLKALLNHGIIRERTDETGIRRLFNKYRGWESYLVLYLWRSLSVPAGLPA